MENPVEWKSLSIIGFSRYLISSTGLAMTLETGYITQGSFSDNGYYNFHLVDDNGKSRIIPAHRAVAYAFHGIPPTSNHTSVDHINRNRGDNSVRNIKWATPSEQNLNKGKRFTKSMGKAITQISLEGIEIMSWFKASSIAKYFNISKSGIYRGCNENKIYGGFRWKYARDNISGEQWKQIVNENFSVIVWASNKGRIATSDGRITFGNTNSHGYKTINIKCKNGKSEENLIHRLVMEAFFGKDERYVNHINNNRKCNLLENLEYVTPKENMRHAVDVANKIKNHPNLSKAVVQMDLDGLYINEFPSGKEAERQTGISAKRISDVINGRYNFHKTFKWAHKKNYVHIGYSPLYKGDIK